jgi:hypothetical protein
MRHLLAFTTLLALSAPAVACINHSESKSHEREFRSQYQDSQYVPPQPVTAGSSRDYVLGGSGVLMALVGATVLYRQRGQV